MNTQVFEWTTDRQWELKCLAEGGWTAQQVADRWGISRNAVLGRAHRTGVVFPQKVRPKKPKPSPKYKHSEEWRAAHSEVMRRLHAEGRMGLTTRKPRQFRLEALALHFAGYSYMKVGRIMGCYHHSVYNWTKDPDLVSEAKGIAARVKAEVDAAKAAAAQAEADRRELIAEINADIVVRIEPRDPRMAMICRRYLAGESGTKIGEDLGITRERVYQILGYAKAQGVMLPKLRRKAQAPKHQLSWGAAA